MLVSKSDPLCHIFAGKILSLGTKSKGFPADIYCIRTKNNRDLENFQAAGRH